MRDFLKLFTISLICLLSACGGDSTPITPSETLKAYSAAVRKKDVKMMKFLLSKASLKIHREQANAQDVSLNEIILRETLFPVDQKFLYKRNEKIEGDMASIEVKNSFDSWDLIYFVKEENIWKIDKKGFSDNTIKQNDADNKKLDDLIDQNKETTEDNTNDSENSNVDQSVNSNVQPGIDVSPGNITNQDDRVTPLPKTDDKSGK